LDGLAVDLFLHVFRNYRLEVAKRVRPNLHRGLVTKASSARTADITVAALKPGGGATTVGLELAVGLAMAGAQVSLWEPGSEPYLRLGMTGPGRHEPSGLEVLGSGPPPAAMPGLLVKVLPPGKRVRSKGRVVLVLTPGHPRRIPKGVLPVVNRQAIGSSECPAIPDDVHVRRAEELRESVLLAFPEAPASKTFIALAEALHELVQA
jgi:hypothetical protein